MSSKRLAAAFAALVIVVSGFSSCTNSVLKTEEPSASVKQTSVVLTDKSTENPDYADFFKAFASTGTVVPGLFEGVVPQGLCYSEKLGSFIISGYYDEAAFPSVLMFVDYSTGEMTKYLTLKNIDGTDYTGHAGGIAVSENTLFLTSDNEAVTIALKTLNEAKNGTATAFESRFKLQTGGAFCCVENGILWAGDFTESSEKSRKGNNNVLTLASGETFYAYCEGYVLEDGLPSVEKISKDGEGYIPDYFLAIPEQTQGMSVLPGGKLYFSTSYGRKNNSYLYKYSDVLSGEPSDKREVDGVRVPVYACDQKHLQSKVTAPPMTEGVCFVDGDIYLLFESGAAKYRSHGGKYPLDTLFKATAE